MSVVIDKLSGSKVKINIEVSKEMFQEGLDDAFEKAVKKVTIKGFRKGKAPKNIFIKNYGEAVLFEDAINYCINHTYGDALEANKIDAVASPKIDLNFDKVSKEDGFKYSVEVAVKPELTLGKYTNLGLAQEAQTVTDMDIQLGVEALIKDQVVQVEKATDVLEEGDIAIIDFEGFLGAEAFEGGRGENYSLTIGSGQFIPGFETQLVGMKKAQTKDIMVTFPTEYHSENLAGKEAKFVVTLHDIKVKQLPALTEEIIAGLNIDGVKTEADLRSHVQTKTLERKNQNAEDVFVEKIMDVVGDNATVEIADEHIDQEVNKMLDDVNRQAQKYKMSIDMYVSLSMGGKTVADLKKELAKQAVKKIKYAAILEAVAKDQALKIEKADLDEKYEEFAKSYGMAAEQVRSMIPESALTNDILFEKAIKYLMANAK